MYQEDVLQGVVKHLNMTFFSGQEWVFQQDSVPAQKGQDISGVAVEERSGLHQCQEFVFWSTYLRPLDNKLWDVLEDMTCQTVSQQPRDPEEIPFEGSSRDPPGDGACGDSRVARAS